MAIKYLIIASIQINNDKNMNNVSIILHNVHQITHDIDPGGSPNTSGMKKAQNSKW